jgi:RNA polymerase sigma-70 factor (ECF subfamily)
MRAVGREAFANAAPEVSVAGLAAEIVGRATTASAAAVRAEAREIVQQALANMDPMDREVLVLRHFEMLSNEETAHELEIEK